MKYGLLPCFNGGLHLVHWWQTVEVLPLQLQKRPKRRREVDDVMTSTAGRPAPPAFDSASTSLSSFRGCSMAEVRRIIMSSPIKSCTLDPMSTFLVRQHVDLLLPYVTTMINSSLTQGRLPESQKHRLWRHCYKTGPGTSSMANFRPVSNLSFMSKVVEKVVSQQLNEHLTDQALLPRHQSTYRKYHSTETHTMLRVMSDVLTAADQQCMMPIGLCRPFLAAATTGTHVRLVWDDSALADVILYRQKSASDILWSAVTHTVSAVRSFAGGLF